MARRLRPSLVATAPVPAGPARPAGLWRQGLPALLGLAAAGVVLRLTGSGALPWMSNLVLIFSSLLVQAFPFILLGALVSAAIEVFVPSRVFARLGGLRPSLQLPVAGLTGVAFPVCECGSVPVARRLAAKGLTASAAVTFMLAAPIVNPIVLVSTAVAYRGRSTMWVMVLGRFVLGLLAAIAVGWVIGRRRTDEVLRPRRGEDVADEHHHQRRGASYFSHFASDLVFMGRYLVLGAGAAAALQTFVPQSVIASVSGTPVLDVLAMMGLAAVLSLCSESDAFVAASFVQFAPAAQLAFLLVGPMFNVKLAALYAGTFSRGFVRIVLAVVAVLVLAGTLWIGVFVR